MSVVTGRGVSKQARVEAETRYYWGCVVAGRTSEDARAYIGGKTAKTRFGQPLWENGDFEETADGKINLKDYAPI